MKVFLSYSHRQREWVCERLVLCLKAGGADVLIDAERMRVGGVVKGQMDDMQDEADTSVLVLSPDYLASEYCRHEMDRAIARRAFVPILRLTCPSGLPELAEDHLYADLRDDNRPDPWAKVLEACDANLGASASHWLCVREDIVRYLTRHQSVNLVVSGRPKWRELIGSIHVGGGSIPVLDLDHGGTVHRAGFVEEVLRLFGQRAEVLHEPRDLGVLSRFLGARPRTVLAVIRFENVAHRDFGIDFFLTLRHHVDNRSLVLLIESRADLAALLPQEHPLSGITNLQTVPLRGY